MIRVTKSDRDQDKWAKALAPLLDTPDEWDEMPEWVPLSVADIINAGDYRGCAGYQARVHDGRVQVRAKGT